MPYRESDTHNKYYYLLQIYVFGTPMQDFSEKMLNMWSTWVLVKVQQSQEALYGSRKKSVWVYNLLCTISLHAIIILEEKRDQQQPSHSQMQLWSEPWVDNRKPNEDEYGYNSDNSWKKKTQYCLPLICKLDYYLIKVRLSSWCELPNNFKMLKVKICCKKGLLTTAYKTQNMIFSPYLLVSILYIFQI